MKTKTRFSNLDEFYPAVALLIEWLVKDGYLKDSQNLKNAMIAGSSGSETLGNIVRVIKGMKGNYSSGLRNEIKECYEFALHHRKIMRLDR